jgi:hypothetical protein
MLKLDESGFIHTPRKPKDSYFSSSDSTIIANSSTTAAKNTQSLNHNSSKLNANNRYTMNHFVNTKPKKSKTFAYKSYSEYKAASETVGRQQNSIDSSNHHRSQSKNVHFRPPSNDNFVKLLDNQTDNNSNLNNHFIKTTLLGTLSNSTVQSIKTATISIQQNDANGSNSKLITNGILLNLNKIGSNLPLANVTNIKSSSFRHSKNYTKPDINKCLINSSLLSHSHHIGQQSSRTNSISNNRNILPFNKSELSKDYYLKNESKLDELSTPSTTTKQSLHRLVKIASNWNPTKDSNHHSNSTNSAYNAKLIERSLISQSKIRKTQMFLNDEHEYVDEESCLSRKLAEINERLNKIKLTDDTSSDKNLRLSNKVKTQPSIIPVMRRYLESESDSSSKNDINSWNNSNDLITSDDYSSSNTKKAKNSNSNYYSAQNKRIISKANSNASNFNKLTQQISIEI